MDNRLNGLNPLSYMGVAPLSVAQLLYKTFDPTPTDSQNFALGAVWINTNTLDVWILVNLARGVATWVKFTGGSGNVITLTGNSGGPISPLAGNINIVGSGDITVVGTPGTHTLTISNSGTGADRFHTQSGDAIPVAGILNVVGTGVISTSGAGNTITIIPSGAIASQYHTDTGVNAVPAAGILNIIGTANQITTNGAGNTVTAAFTPSIIVVNNISNTSGSITTNTGPLAAVNSQNSNVANILQFVKNRSGGAITTGDPIGFIQWYGFDGTGNLLAAQISAKSSGTIALNRVASDLEFYTHPDAPSATPSQRMLLNSAGNLTINSPDSNGLPLTIQNSPGGAGSGAASICCGSGDPNTVVTATQGSLYLRLDGSSSSTRAYINTNGATAWTNITTAA